MNNIDKIINLNSEGQEHNSLNANTLETKRKGCWFSILFQIFLLNIFFFKYILNHISIYFIFNSQTPLINKFSDLLSRFLF